MQIRELEVIKENKRGYFLNTVYSLRWFACFLLKIAPSHVGFLDFM